MWRRAYHSTVSTQATTTRRSALTAWAPVVVWAAVIFAFSAVPSLGTGVRTWDHVLRKLSHLTEYAILGVLLARATRRPVVALVLAAAYAATDEVHQTFVEGRHGTPRDVAIDTLGALVGVCAWTWWRRRA
jgi:VanZ family protein